MRFIRTTTQKPNTVGSVKGTISTLSSTEPTRPFTTPRAEGIVNQPSQPIQRGKRPKEKQRKTRRKDEWRDRRLKKVMGEPLPQLGTLEVTNIKLDESESSPSLSPFEPSRPEGLPAPRGRNQGAPLNVTENILTGVGTPYKSPSPPPAPTTRVDRNPPDLSKSNFTITEPGGTPRVPWATGQHESSTPATNTPVLLFPDLRVLYSPADGSSIDPYIASYVPNLPNPEQWIPQGTWHSGFEVWANWNQGGIVTHATLRNCYTGENIHIYINSLGQYELVPMHSQPFSSYFV